MSDPNFNDHFSKQSAVYAASRPAYPDNLYEFIFSKCEKFDQAWDCGTGNGQAAIKLSKKFDKVLATDASEAQLKHAIQANKITYKVCKSEQSLLPDRSIDLITAATAVHWFDLPNFYTEVNRVLKPEGILAVWTYGIHSVSNVIDNILRSLNEDILKDHWPEQIKYPFEQYRSLPFPLADPERSTFRNSVEWNCAMHENYLMSWSGIQKSIASNDKPKVQQFFNDIRTAWGDVEEYREVSWEIFLLTGKPI